MLAIFHVHYNFVHIQQTLRVTPAMEAGITTRLSSVYDIASFADSERAKLAA